MSKESKKLKKSNRCFCGRAGHHWMFHDTWLTPMIARDVHCEHCEGRGIILRKLTGVVSEYLCSYCEGVSINPIPLTEFYS
jgi:hypothetical protein